MEWCRVVKRSPGGGGGMIWRIQFPRANPPTHLNPKTFSSWKNEILNRQSTLRDPFFCPIYITTPLSP